MTLVQPGKSFAIVENTSSARKTPTQFTISPEQRFFGADSIIQGGRFASQTYTNVIDLLGKQMDFVPGWKDDKFIMTEIKEDERGLPGWVVAKEDGEDILYTEEVLAVLMKLGRNYAEKQAD